MDDLSICMSVRTCVGLSSTLSKNGGSDPDAVWHDRSNGSRFGDRSTGRGTFGGEFEAGHYNQRDFTAYVCDSAATRPSSQITLSKLVTVINVQLPRCSKNIKLPIETVGQQARDGRDAETMERMSAAASLQRRSVSR